MKEELKTLKDLEKCGIVPCDKGLHLKSVTSRELKAEAVKWVKYYQKHDEETEEASQWLRMWIIKFFNLTDDDIVKREEDVNGKAKNNKL